MSDSGSPTESALGGRKIILGVSGGIAAYKAVELLRILVKSGADVAPVLTEAATRFVTSLTFDALAGRRAGSSLWGGDDPIPHTTLGRWADAVVVAPATADLIARYAAGIADDLLTATLLATEAPVLVAPAMHHEMWNHPATVENVATLRGRGVVVIEPDAGPLAGGDEGQGRLPEPEAIARELARLAGIRPATLAGRQLLVTAGGTREPIDPVRFIGNRSSGRMGHAIAAEAAARGAVVTLITSSPLPSGPGVEVVRVETAEEMEAAVQSGYASSDCVVMAAAVADFRPKSQARRKLKKSEGLPEIYLEPTPDILAELGGNKAGQVLIGFAAETEDLVANAKAKLAAKNVDLMVANDVAADDSGFEVSTNRATLLWPDGRAEELGLLSKEELAAIVLDRAEELGLRTG